jgi:hypothetical protein
MPRGRKENGKKEKRIFFSIFGVKGSSLGVLIYDETSKTVKHENDALYSCFTG